MPIDNLTNQAPSYPRLGELRKGEPKRKTISKKTGKEIEVAGRDLDHFRFVSDNPAATRRFLEVYGPEPREVNVYLPFATRAENLDSWMKLHGAGSLKLKCTRPQNGRGGVVLWQDDAGQFHTEPKDCMWPDCGCKPHTVLKVIIPELVEVAGIGLVWVMSTAFNDAAELDRNLAAAEDTARGLGRDLRGIPFVLSRQLDEVSCPPREGENGNGKRLRQGKWMLHIEPNVAWVAMQMAAFQRLAMAPSVIPQLEAGPSEFDRAFDDDGETIEEDEVIEAEVETPDEPEAGIQNEARAPKDNGNGRKGYDRAGLIARINALAGQLKINVDPAHLDGMTEAELVGYGKELRQQTDKAAKQASLDLAEAA